ncbi:MAG: hypothetical protein IKT31_03965 [Firmicutes bacterium]|nr:hypothetical protein [Bacillota bacterium]
MMRNSKILLGAAIVVGLVILVIFVAVFFMAGGTASQPDAMFVHNFDSQIADMKIVNGEKEYFAVVKNSRGQLAIIDLKVLE